MVALEGPQPNGTWWETHALPVNGTKPPIKMFEQWPEAPVDELEVERRRLQVAIDTANARAAAARARAAAKDADVRAALREEIEASRLAIAEMEREHQRSVEMIRAAAQAEIERIRGHVVFPTGGSDTRSSSGWQT